MDETTKRMTKYSKILIALVVVLLIGIGLAAYFIYQKNNQIEEMQQMHEITKQQLEDEYDNIDTQYEGFKITIKNDSLLQQLSNEQAKVQRLREELKTVKATDRAEINRLNNELASLRKVLRSYVVQIDSLNRLNEKLAQENKEISNKYERTSQTLNKVTKEKENLSEKVTLAAKLDATSVRVSATNKKGKEQKKIKNIEQLAVSFLITKNITAQPGEKTIYVRIMKPDDDVLVKNRANTFPYENRDVQYSMKRVIEYGGQEVPVTLYWKVEEFLMPGTYRVDIFADGNLIGSGAFSLEK